MEIFRRQQKDPRLIAISQGQPTSARTHQPTVTPEIRSPDLFYQLAQAVASVNGAVPNFPEGKITFGSIQPNDKLDPSMNVEYREYILYCEDAGRELPSARLPPGTFASNVLVGPALGWSCEIVGKRQSH
jgi:hypothetical protein